MKETISKHTPGPWSAHDCGYTGPNGEREWWITAMDNAYSICIVRARTLNPHIGEEKTLEDNARLIAAAPQMFHTLHQIKNLIEDPDNWNPNRPINRAAVLDVLISTIKIAIPSVKE